MFTVFGWLWMSFWCAVSMYIGMRIERSKAVALPSERGLGYVPIEPTFDRLKGPVSSREEGNPHGHIGA
jgi:hypothetical protein